MRRASLSPVGLAVSLWYTRKFDKECTAPATGAKQTLVLKRFASNASIIGVISAPTTRKSIFAIGGYTFYGFFFLTVFNRHKKNKPAGYYDRDQSDSESEKPVPRRHPRTYKKIRQRVHWKCSKCSGAFQYGTKICDCCGSRRDVTGIRDPYVSPSLFKQS